MSYKHETRLHVQSELARRGWSKAAQVIIEFFDALENSDEYKATQSTIADLQATVDRLRGALTEAIESVEDWSGYASPYFRDKYDVEGQISSLRSVLKNI